MTSTTDNNLSPYMIGWSEFGPLMDGKCAFMRGESVLISSLTYNFKSGFIRTVLAQIAYLNKPAMIDSARKPLLVLIDGENEVIDNLSFLAKNALENVIGENVDQVTDDVIDAGINLLKLNGFHIAVVRYSPNDYSVDNLFETLDDYEEDGYELHGLFVDGLNFFTRPVDTCLDEYYPEITKRIKAYTVPRQAMLFVTHQLNSQCARLAREYKDDITVDYLSEIAGKGYHDSCPQLAAVYHSSFLIGVTRGTHGSALTVVREKRLSASDPIDKPVVHLPFADTGTIPWDAPLLHV